MNAIEFLSTRIPVRDLTAEHSHHEERPPIVADPGVGTSGESPHWERIGRILFRTERHHLLLYGPRGVGKTAVVLEFAGAVARGAMRFLAGSRVLWIDTQYVGPEDSRACLETLATVVGEHPRIVLCVDGIQSLMRRPHGGDNKHFLLGLLRSPGLRLIGVLPRSEYGELFAGDVDLLREFDQLEVLEPTDELALGIVEGVANRFRDQYQLAIDADVVRRSVHLTANYVLNEYLPDKAIRAVREACDRVRYLRDELGQDRRTVTAADLMAILAEKTGIPRETLEGTSREANWETALSARVVGQGPAVAAVAEELRLIKAGLAGTGKPASVMLFAGMTGVGKTELARRLAELYSASHQLQNYSMANFTEPHSVSGIVGVPPGYVGHEHGGRLINDLNGDPYGVFLLDEAEKAHPNVWKPFLTLFDEGWIVDQRGVKARADRAMFILTTNVGAEEISQMTRAGKSVEEIEERVVAQLSRFRQERTSQPVFPPAFLARIRKIVVFRPLDEDAMCRIAAASVETRRSQWLQRWEQALEVDERIVKWIGRRAYRRNELSQGREGGRIVQKLMSTTIDAALAHAMGVGRFDGQARTLRLRAISLPDEEAEQALPRLEIDVS
jgi:ATP-dependent Clp protease ATP-binding subunit ClpA